MSEAKPYRDRHSPGYNKAYAEKNREYLAAYKKGYREKHKEELQAYGKEYRKKHPEKAEKVRLKYANDPEFRKKLLEKDQIYAKAHPEKARARGQKYKNSHREEVRERVREWRKANPDHYLKATYGITRKEFGILLDEQGGVCAVCKKTEWGKHGPHVDHDHSTMAVRGILCGNCNRAVGIIQENPQTAKNMAIYIESFQGDEK